MKKKAILVSIVCNLFNFFAVAACVARFFVRSGDGNMRVTGWLGFVYFTVDSNVLAALVSAVLAFYCLTQLRQDELELPRWLLMLKLMGTSAVTLTLVTVLVFLGPIYGYESMFVGSNLWLHLICPLLCIGSFVLLERGAPLPLSATLPAVLPTVLYGAVYLLCVVVLRVWQDFYAFNVGGRWYISAPVMIFASWLLACALRWANRLCSAKRTAAVR